MRPARDSESLRQEQDVGGAGQQEAAGRALPVHRRLEGGEEAGGVLHLVEDDGAGQSRQKALGVAAGRGEDADVVQGEVGGGALRGQGLDEGGLAGLACAVDQDDGAVGEGVGEWLCEQSPIHGHIMTIAWLIYKAEETPALRPV